MKTKHETLNFLMILKKEAAVVRRKSIKAWLQWFQCQRAVTVTVAIRQTLSFFFTFIQF